MKQNIKKTGSIGVRQARFTTVSCNSNKNCEDFLKALVILNKSCYTGFCKRGAVSPGFADDGWGFTIMLKRKKERVVKT